MGHRIEYWIICMGAAAILAVFYAYEAIRSESFRRWCKLIFLSAVLGIYTAEMIVFLPDWIRADLAFWWPE